jgi:CheY-like chemotaxis protein
MVQRKATVVSNRTSWRILLVDDSVLASEATKRLLESAGHKVRTALDGKSALKTAAEFAPELLLLDISLPDMSGYEVLRRLKQIDSLSKSFFVALSGYGEEERGRARQAGFDEFIIKPFDLEAFGQLVATKRFKTSAATPLL